MEKSNAIIKVDSTENWNKAINYVPDVFTIVIYKDENKAPRIKIGDGIHKVNELTFLVNDKEVKDDTLVL